MTHEVPCMTVLEQSQNNLKFSSTLYKHTSTFPIATQLASLVVRNELHSKQQWSAKFSHTNTKDIALL